MQEILPEVIKARLSLLHRFPLFGNLSLKLKIVEDNNKPTIATDGVVLSYNRDFVLSITKEERVFILLHEIMHIVCLHHVRFPKNCNFKIWNVACDYVVNALILEMKGIKAPDSILYDPKYKDWTALNLYRELMKEFTQESKKEDNADDSDNSDTDSNNDNNGNDNNSDNSKESDEQDDRTEQGESGDKESNQEKEGKITEKKIKELIEAAERHGLIEESQNDLRQEELATISSINITNRLVEKSSQLSNKQKQTIPETIKEEIEERTSIGLPWHRILADFITKSASNDWDWQEPDPQYCNSDIIMPSIKSDSANEFAIAIDTSGSINRDQLVKFITETKQILTDIEYSKVHIIYCSNKIKHYDVFTKEDDIKLVETGSGGTAFFPVFEFIKEQDIHLSGLIYFTDLECDEDSIGEEPNCPVLWCVFDSTFVDFVRSSTEYENYLPKFGQIVVMDQK